MNNELIRLERIIQIGFDAFADAAGALAQIKDQELFKPEHSSFRAYLKSRWGMKLAYAYRIAAAGGLINELRTVLGDNAQLPNTEHTTHALAQAAKALADITASQATTQSAAIVWDIAQRAAEIAGKPQPTAADVRRVGDVLAELATTDAIDIAGEQFTLAGLVANTAAYEVVEARLRQREHIAKHKPRQIIARGRGCVSGGRFIELNCELPSGLGEVEVVIYSGVVQEQT